MKLTQIRHFVAVARQGSVASAAAATGVSRHALRRSIRDLEQALGAALFVRGDRSMTLTAVGEIFFRRTAAAQLELDRASQEIGRDPGSPSGPVSIALSADPRVAMPPQALAPRQTRLEGVRLHRGEATLRDRHSLGRQPGGNDMLTHCDVILRPDASRTVVRPFSPDYPSRFQQPDRSRLQVIVDRILGLDAAGLAREHAQVVLSLDERHRDVDDMLMRRFDDLAGRIADAGAIDDDRRRLIGAYFSEEYAYEAAALFNPSAVLHPDQSGAPEGGCRFVLSLRGIGEGHVSSVAFRTGSWTPGGALTVDRPSDVAMPPIVEGDRVAEDSAVRLDCGRSRELSETVLFPVLPSQRQGIEDVRLVRFVADDGAITYYGTYTAFSGAEARPQMLSGTDFTSFAMRPLSGDAADAKGMALFPRLVGGRYMMLGRQDSESVWIHASDDVYHWNGGAKLVSPRYPWEFVQMGNCGSPIEVDEGWLVLTHGVGTVRNYCMGACLLDKADPSKLLARTPRPILEPSPEERDGYVPNVVYSCGALAHGRDLMIPYGVADEFTAFATTTIDALLAAME